MLSSGLHHSGLDFCQLRFPNSLDGWLSCLCARWEVLDCKAGLETEKAEQEGEGHCPCASASAVAWGRGGVGVQRPPVDAAAAEPGAMAGAGQRSGLPGSGAELRLAQLLPRVQ